MNSIFKKQHSVLFLLLSFLLITFHLSIAYSHEIQNNQNNNNNNNGWNFLRSSHHSFVEKKNTVELSSIKSSSSSPSSPYHYIVGQGWDLFFFTENSSEALPEMKVDASSEQKNPLLISITDAFCSGDQFEVYVDGEKVGSTSEPRTMVCKGTWDPEEAFNDPHFSTYQFQIPSGAHTVKIKSSKSPYRGGAAYIRIDEQSSDICSSTSETFVVVTKGVPEENAPQTCERNGLRLARVTSTNFMDAVETAYNCVGPYGRLWAYSWNGDNYGDECIALHLGAEAGGGSFNVPVGGCNQPLPVLCERIESEENND